MVELRVLRPSDAEFQELCTFRGRLFSDWMNKWNQWSTDEADAFSHPVWTISWLYAFAANNDDSYRLYVFYAGTEFVSAIPLQIIGLRTLVGKQYYLRHPYNKFSSGASVALQKKHHRDVFEKIFETPVRGARKPLMVQFDKVDATNDVLHSELHIATSKVKPRYALSITESHAETLKKLSKAFQRNLRNYDRKVDALANVSIEFYDKTPDLFEAFDKFTGLEASGWKGKAGSAVEYNGAARDFFVKAIEGLSNSNEVVIPVIEANGDCIAASLNYRKNDVLYGLKTAYNEKFSKLAPGHLLINRLIRGYCVGKDIRVINAIHNPKWFEVWRPDELPTYRLQVFPSGTRGLCAKSILFPLWNTQKIKKILVDLNLWDTLKQSNWRIEQW